MVSSNLGYLIPLVNCNLCANTLSCMLFWSTIFSQIVVPYHCVSSTKTNTSVLNSDHSYFLLADNGTVGKYGGEILFRKKFEKYIAQQKICISTWYFIYNLINSYCMRALLLCHSFILKLLPLAWYSPENGMWCVMLILSPSLSEHVLYTVV